LIIELPSSLFLDDIAGIGIGWWWWLVAVECDGGEGGFSL
jgi:hypothetical protein